MVGALRRVDHSPMTSTSPSKLLRRGLIAALATTAIVPSIAAADVTVTPGPLEFANQQVLTTSPAQDITVTNNSDCPILVGLTKTGAADFSITSDVSSSDVLTPGASRAYHASFTPTQAGRLTGLGQFYSYPQAPCQDMPTSLIGAIALGGTGVAAPQQQSQAPAPAAPTTPTGTASPTPPTSTTPPAPPAKPAAAPAPVKPKITVHVRRVGHTIFLSVTVNGHVHKIAAHYKDPMPSRIWLRIHLPGGKVVHVLVQVP
jgi:hypothetical protein